MSCKMPGLTEGSAPPQIGARRCRYRRGQGATEYLVLLAVVLIVALVSVALLGFFPGMASDAQITQSKMYWSSASPISILEVHSVKYTDPNFSPAYIKVMNTGAYPIRITKLVSGNYSISKLNGGAGNIADYFYLAPGEERAFATADGSLLPPGGTELRVQFSINYSASNVLDGAKQYCTNSSNYVMYDSFGFEYVLYVENQPITKRQIGAKPLFFRCN